MLAEFPRRDIITTLIRLLGRASWLRAMDLLGTRPSCIHVLDVGFHRTLFFFVFLFSRAGFQWPIRRQQARLRVYLEASPPLRRQRRKPHTSSSRQNRCRRAFPL